MRQQYYYYGLILFYIFLNGCTPKGLPKTTQDFKENLEPYQHQFHYQASVYEGQGLIVKLPAPVDTSHLKFDATAYLNDYLDRVVIAYKPAIEKVYREGYRIQIYRGKSKTDADRAKQRCYELFPKITPYMTYSAPNYRVKIGDFLETSEYINIYNRLKREFPTALVVPDIVNVIIMNEPGSTYKDKDKKK